jgi:hypothetical protein
MSNYPAGFTQGEHDRTFADAPNQFPNTEECFLCHLQIEQDDDTRWWFDANLAWKPTFRSDWLDSFETQSGWVCSSQCWNDRVALNEDESIPARPVLMLIQGGRHV